MPKGLKMLFLVFAFVVNCLQAGALVCPAYADVTYTYIGNPFETYAGNYYDQTGHDVLYSAISISGSFTIATALPPNAPLIITPLSCSLTNGSATWTGNASTFIFVATNASGQISNWDVFLFDSTGYIQTEKETGVTVDTWYASSSTDWSYLTAYNTGNPGQWTIAGGGPAMTPLPPAVFLLAPDLVGLLTVRRRFKG